jgi:outer membrane protein TolC
MRFGAAWNSSRPCRKQTGRRHRPGRTGAGVVRVAAADIGPRGTELRTTQLLLDRSPASGPGRLPSVANDRRVRLLRGSVSLQYSAFDPTLIANYKARCAAETASALSTRDSRDVVVLAVETAYFQVVASEARLATARAALASAQEFQTQVAHEFRAEVAPEIDSIRASVELHAAEQRVTDAENDLEKDKLTLDRITGIRLEQKWSPAHEYRYKPLPADNAKQTKFDLDSARVSMAAAELDVKSAAAERLPAVSIDATYGTGGINPGNRVGHAGNDSAGFGYSGREGSGIQRIRALKYPSGRLPCNCGCAESIP